MTVGLNLNVVAVFMTTTLTSSSEHIKAKIYMIGQLSFAAGAGWVAVLGYFLIESMGWRVFVMCTSVPLAIPAILMLHFCFKDGQEEA